MAKDNQLPFGKPAQPIAPYFPSQGENVYGGGYLVNIILGYSLTSHSIKNT